MKTAAEVMADLAATGKALAAMERARKMAGHGRPTKRRRKPCRDRRRRHLRQLQRAVLKGAYETLAGTSSRTTPAAKANREERALRKADNRMKRALAALPPIEKETA